MNILEEVKGAKSIAIGGHVRPDADCVGSCLGMYLFLKKVMPGDAQITVYLENPPAIYNCIKGFDTITGQLPDKAPDVFIVLDCNKDRLGFSEPLFEEAPKKINIDHHISNKGVGDINLIDPDASSASEMVYRVIDHDKMDADIALALYVGIIGDTGVFQYSCTSPETMRVGADLISYGIDFPNLILSTFYEKTYIQNLILGRALIESVRFMDGKCIVTKVDRSLMEFYHATPKDLDGIVNQLRNTTGVECAIFMYETEHHEYKVSLRTTERVDAAAITEHFGGGGHARAAGCTMNGTYHDNINNLSELIEKQLEQSAGK